MSTVMEIEKAIEKLPTDELLVLRYFQWEAGILSLPAVK